jgi:peptide-methionine (S)-S-oxide reductase
MLLDVYWHSIDPTQADGQFCDRGESYLSAVFVRNDAQRRAAEATKKNVQIAMKDKPVATRILPAGPFYRAEEYHQDYAKKNPEHYGMYRLGCRRDARLQQVWGDQAAKPVAQH